MKIAVSGCGITGASVASMLAAAGHDVTVFEQADKCQSIGAGILISPSGQQALQRLGVLEETVQTSARLKGLRAQHTNGKRLVELNYSSLDSELFGLGVHRGRLFTALLGQCAAAGVKLVNSFQVHDVSLDGDQRVVKNQNGDSQGGFDLVLATDGSNSILRQHVDIRTRVINYAFAALWTTAPCKFQPDSLVQYVEGTEKLIGLLPIGDGHSSFFWGLRSNEFEALRSNGFANWREEVLRCCPDAESVFDTLTDFEQMTFAGYRHVTMAKWCDLEKRVLFLGDAAHATSPHLGQGANLGLEDAVAFAEAVEHSGNDIAAAFKSFAKMRSRKVRYYQQLTRLLTPFFQSDQPWRALPRDVVLPWLPHLPVSGRQMVNTLCGFQRGWF